MCSIVHLIGFEFGGVFLMLSEKMSSTGKIR